MVITRQFWVIAHRYAGLTLALFMIIVGTTGSLLSFNHELRALTSPWMAIAPPTLSTPMLDPIALFEAAQRAEPNVEMTRVELHRHPAQALIIGVDSKTDTPLGYDEIALNPYTGDVVYRGTWADLSEGWHQIMPFLYSLHYSLALGEWGSWTLGIAALIWTIDCFIGFYLTLPRTRRNWWKGWTKSWKLKLPSPSGYRFSFDLHRAAGLWMWPLLLVFAWSSVGFNLREIYNPAMGAFGMTDVFETIPDNPAPANLTHDWRARLAQGRALGAELGAKQSFTVVREDALGFREKWNLYEYRFAASDDIRDRGNGSRIFFDTSGKVVATMRNNTQPTANSLDAWLTALHIADVFGLPYRIFVSVLGLLITALSVTGVVIWMRKRSARIARPINPDQPSPAPA